MSPPGTRIARWYCPQAHCTWSALPDHMAARFPGTLIEIEAVVAAVEQAQSLERAADQLRPDEISLPSALRWMRRRVRMVQRVLDQVVALWPRHLVGCAATLKTVEARLGYEWVLMYLRIAAPLEILYRPVGFYRAPLSGVEAGGGLQHYLGRAPPVVVG